MDLSKIRLTYTESEGIHKKIPNEMRKFVHQRKLTHDQREFVRVQKEKGQGQQQQVKGQGQSGGEGAIDSVELDQSRLQFISEYQRDKYVDEWCENQRNVNQQQLGSISEDNTQVIPIRLQSPAAADEPVHKRPMSTFGKDIHGSGSGGVAFSKTTTAGVLQREATITATSGMPGLCCGAIPTAKTISKTLKKL